MNRKSKSVAIKTNASKFENAEVPYLNTIELLEELSADDSSIGDIRELALTGFQNGKLLFKSDNFSESEIVLSRAVELFDSLMILDANSEHVEMLAEALTWQARVNRKLSLLDDAIESYERAIAIFRILIEVSTKSQQRVERKLMLGSNLLGLSKALKSIGEKSLAESVAEESYGILKFAFESRNPHSNPVKQTLN